MMSLPDSIMAHSLRHSISMSSGMQLHRDYQGQSQMSNGINGINGSPHQADSFVGFYGGLDMPGAAAVSRGGGGIPAHPVAAAAAGACGTGPLISLGGVPRSEVPAPAAATASAATASAATASAAATAAAAAAAAAATASMLSPSSVAAGGSSHGALSPVVGGGGAGYPAPKPIRRRMRMITSCLECRRRKLKCNKQPTCTNCLKFSRDCRYLGPKLDEASQLRLTEIKEKVGSLERQLERDVAKSAAASASVSASVSASASASSSSSRGGAYHQQRIIADDVDDDFDEERDLEITPMVALDLTYDDDVDDTDDLVDLGVQVGRMRLTERVGGLNRPRISEEIQAGLGAQSAASPTLLSPGSSFSGQRPSLAAGMENMHNLAAYEMDAVFDAGLPDFLRPSAAYIPPTSGFFYGQVVESPSLVSFLPNKEAGDRLMQRYFDAVHPIARCVHRPSFEALYSSFWDEVRKCYEPRASTQAVVFAAWLGAAVSLDEARAHREYGMPKSNLIENMKVGTEAALSKANFLRTTKVETMQAFVMYLLPLCREEVSRAHSVLVGAAVRMAECLGLHRDGEAYGLNPLETHVRRLIWHQLCFLDIRTCEAQGPKPAIRRDEYDTKIPLNLEESAFLPFMHDTTTGHGGGGCSSGNAPASTLEPAEHWTSTLLPLIRFEINEMMRIIWSERRKLEARRTTLAAVLAKVEDFRKRMLDKYDRLLDDRVPIRRYAKLVMHLLMYRLHTMVLHTFHINAAAPMPARLTSVLIMSSIMVLEIAMELETNPQFRDWAWYSGAYQQFHIALLLATEIYYRPASREADRIWRCLDYAFGLDPDAPRDQKGVSILAEVAGKTAVYTNMRKARAPTGLARAVPDPQAVKESPAAPPPPALPTATATATATASTITTTTSNANVMRRPAGPGSSSSPHPLPAGESSSLVDPFHLPQGQRQQQQQVPHQPQNPHNIPPHQHQHQHLQENMKSEPDALIQQQQHMLPSHGLPNIPPPPPPQQQQQQQQQSPQQTGIPHLMPSSRGVPLPNPAASPGPGPGPGHAGHDMIFPGVMPNGELPWNIPPQQDHLLLGSGSAASPETSSENGSTERNASVSGPVGYGLGGPGFGGGAGEGDVTGMDGIDLEMINVLFPPDPQTGEYSFNAFVDPSIGMLPGHWPPQG